MSQPVSSDSTPTVRSLATLVLGLPLAAVMALTDGGTPRPLLQLAVFGAISWWALLVITNASPRQLLERLPSIGITVSTAGVRQLALGAACGLALSGGLALVAVAATGGNVQVTNRPLTALGTFAALAVVFGLAALGEEALYRGAGVLRQRRYIAAWVVGTSVVFGASHTSNDGFGWAAFFTICVSGGVFSVVALATRQLWASWGLHAGWNLGLGGLFGLPVSGFTFDGPLATTLGKGSQVVGPTSFGLEGTPAATALWCLALVAVLAAGRRALAPVVDHRFRPALHDPNGQVAGAEPG